MTSRTFQIERLPEETKALAQGVRKAAGELLKTSIERLMMPTWPIGECMVLRDVKFWWNFYMAKEGDEVVFFFFQKDRPVRIILDATVSFRAVPIASVEEPIPIDSSQISYRIVLPPFVIAKPSPRQMTELAPEGATAENTILFQVGSGWQNVLAIKDAEQGVSGGKISYIGETENNQGPSQTWRVIPFLALIDSIRSWISAGFDRGEEELLEMLDVANESDPKRILRLVVQAYISAVNSIQSNPPKVTSLLEPLVTNYGISGYQAKVLLRLKPNGELAIDDEDDPFQLLMHISLSPEKISVKARVTIGPPDFIISGPLHEAFISSLQEESALEEIGRLLGYSKDEIKDYLSRVGTRSSIFRTKRERRSDTDILVFPGMLSGRITLSILRGRFEVHAADDPPRVRLIKNSMKLLFAGVPSSTSRGLDNDTIKYFLRFVVAIKHWIEVLP
ncbi:hypothetical protein ACFL9T_05205 [Thermodesulfobacteriota bacterium]